MYHTDKCGRVFRGDNVLQVVLLASLSSVFLWSISGCRSQSEGEPTALHPRRQLKESFHPRKSEPTSGFEKGVAICKKAHSFTEWAGKTKIRGKQLVELGIKPSDFAKYGVLRVYDPNLELEISPSEDRRIARVRVDINVMKSAIDAHEGLVGYISLCTAGPGAFAKGKEGSRWDIGDVCFHGLLFPDRNVLFARNNVLVHLLATSPEDTEMRMDVAALARFIDEKLVASLVPISETK